MLGESKNRVTSVKTTRGSFHPVWYDGYITSVQMTFPFGNTNRILPPLENGYTSYG